MAKKCKADGCDNPIFSTGFCRYHQNLKPKKEKSILRDYTPKEKNKPSGEGLLFQTILQTRPHICFITGEKIHEPDHNNCHHVLHKSGYKRFLLYDKNVIIVSSDIHYVIHNVSRDHWTKYATAEQWKKLDDLYEELRQEYNCSN